MGVNRFLAIALLAASSAAAQSQPFSVFHHPSSVSGNISVTSVAAYSFKGPGSTSGHLEYTLTDDFYLTTFAEDAYIFGDSSGVVIAGSTFTLYQGVTANLILNGSGFQFNTPVVLSASLNAANLFTADGGTGTVTLIDKYYTFGSTPSVGNVGANSCGTTAATIVGNAANGIVTVGATLGTQCRVTFQSAAQTRRQCTVTDESTATLARVAYVDSTHSDLLGSFTAGDVLAYICQVY